MIRKARCGTTNPHPFHRVNEINEAQYDLCVGFGKDGYWADDPRVLAPPAVPEEAPDYWEIKIKAIRSMLEPLQQTDGKQHTEVMVRTLIEQYQDRSQRIEDLERALKGRTLRLQNAKEALAEMAEAELKPVFEIDDIPDVFLRISQAALEKFAAGYSEYGPGAADECGLAGQWGDLHRKVAKLKPSMWSGRNNLTRESQDDILYDIIGHCLLALEMKARGFEGGRS